MKQIFFSLFLTLCTCATLWAQNDGDIFRYSSLGYKGTARSLGVGNAVGALGGDYGALTINPAGLAVYRSSELSISAGVSLSNTESILRGGSNNGLFDELNSKFTFNNIGLVVANDMNRGKWKMGNFAIGLNKLSDFNRTVYYSGTSPGSIGTVYAEELNRGIFDQFTNGLASDSVVGLVLFDGRDYYSDFEDSLNAPLRRSQRTTRSGGVNELNISYAANYDDKLMLGVTLGIPFARFTSLNVYDEEDVNNIAREFIRVNKRDEIITSGTGINVKIGAIYRPSQAFRLGLAIHTPTAYWISESRNADLTFRYFNSNPNVRREEEGSASLVSPEPINYIITTPWRFVASAAFVAGKNGFISADVEAIDYTSGRLRFDLPDGVDNITRDDFRQAEANVNADVKEFYKTAFNFRVGGELALDIFRLRAGINLLGSADVDFNDYQKVYTAGVGLRGKYIFGDLGYRVSDAQEFTVSPYSSPNGFRQQTPVADVTSRASSWVFTLGLRF